MDHREREQIRRIVAGFMEGQRLSAALAYAPDPEARWRVFGQFLERLRQLR